MRFMITHEIWRTHLQYIKQIYLVMGPSQISLSNALAAILKMADEKHKFFHILKTAPHRAVILERKHGFPE